MSWILIVISDEIKWFSITLCLLSWSLREHRACYIFGSWAIPRELDRISLKIFIHYYYPIVKDALRRVLPSISPEYYMFKYNWLASANVLISVCIDTPCVVVSKALDNPSSSHPLPTCCQCQVLEYDNKRKITVIRTMPNCHIVVVICTSIVVRI